MRVITCNIYIILLFSCYYVFLQILITVSIHQCLISLFFWFYLLVILLYLVMFCHSHSRVYFLANAIDNLNACLMDAGKPFYHSCANDQKWSSSQHGIMPNGHISCWF
ncbi:hypothetical protein OIU77_012130 [Salix suchowensis]|uniref:Uncharacterized protein n=1 Tax=Salix suchowensis TaxID=1278906 RepID=A0ABQ9A4A8_9ROSI|nr:hypothetical protein OIU77_012130 [Salix suchowensis]